MSMSKVFNDPIHGSISLPSYCVAVIDTPGFQRLRRIKQLGAAESVYPGATNNRFAHSIGVCHLAGKVIKHLRENQPELDITEKEVKCVQLAGLCHDLGHGPFSHKFESVVNRLLPKGETWNHEKASVKMLDHLNKESKRLKKDELDLIKDLISGKPLETEKKRWSHYKKRRFLYQIVANEDNKIDVDKWDYFARDCHYLGLPNSFDHDRIIPFMRVCTCKREESAETFQEICYRDKLIGNLSSMFAVRWRLHVQAYQHRVVKLTEEMICDALYEYLTEDAKKKNPEFGPVEKIIDDMSIFSQLDDCIIGAISRSKVKKAQEILQRIEQRNLYPCIGEILDAEYGEKVPKEDEIKTWLINDKSLAPYCTEENLVIVSHKYDYGMKADNPLKHVQFYKKGRNNKVGMLFGEEKMPPTLPKKLQLRDVRLYTRANIVPPAKLKEKVEKKIRRQIGTHVTPVKQLDARGGPPHSKKRRNPSNKATDVPASKARKLGK